MTMWLTQRTEFQLHSADTPAALESRMHRRLDSEAHSGPGDIDYFVRRTDEGFELKQFEHTRPSLRMPVSMTVAGPVVRGRFQPTADGTTVEVTVTSEIRRAVIVFAALGGLLIALLGGLAAGTVVDDGYGLARGVAAGGALLLVPVAVLAVSNIQWASTAARIQHDVGHLLAPEGPTV